MGHITMKHHIDSIRSAQLRSEASTMPHGISSSNSTSRSRLKRFFEEWGFIGFFAIFARKAEQFTAAVIQIKNAPLQIINPKALQGIMITQIGLYGFQTLFSMIVNVVKLYNLWTESGPYAQKVAEGKASKTMTQKIRSSIFTSGMALSDLSLFGFTIAGLFTSLTFSGPLAITLVSINASISVLKYLWSIGREIKAGIEDGLNGWRLFDKTLKLSMASMMAAGLMTLVLVSNPYTFAIVSGIFAVWALIRITHYFVKRHILSEKIQQRDIELHEAFNPNEDTSKSTLENESTVAVNGVSHGSVLGRLSDSATRATESSSPVDERNNTSNIESFDVFRSLPANNDATENKASSDHGSVIDQSLDTKFVLPR